MKIIDPDRQDPADERRNLLARAALHQLLARLSDRGQSLHRPATSLLNSK